jgi:integrase
MPRKPRIPKYSLHKSSGRARVIVDGQHIWLGKFGSDESVERYNRLVAELVASPAKIAARSTPPLDGLTVAEVAAAFWAHAEGYYQKDGRATNQLQLIKLALRPVRNLYSRAPASEFGPLALKAVRSQMVQDGLCRKEVNRRIRLVKQAFRWAVAEELIPSGIYEAMRTVDGLRIGRTTAPDHAPIQPVADEVVDATLPHLPPTVAAMVKLQRLSGARPGELCALRPSDVDRSDSDVWIYRPRSHKNQHHGQSRIIYFGPRAREIVAPYLLRPSDANCFSPAESERNRLEELHAKRKTPLSCGNKPGSNRRKRPKRKPRDFYEVKSYRQAIARAVNKANRERIEEAKKRGEEPELLPLWAPNQLRHTAATEIRKTFGLEGAGATMGHSKLDTTQIYAEKNMNLAREIAKKIG